MSPGDKSSKFKNGIEVDATEGFGECLFFAFKFYTLINCAANPTSRFYSNYFLYNRQSVIVCKTANVRVK